MPALPALPARSRAAGRRAARLASYAWWLLTEVIDGVGRHHVSMLAKQAAYSLLFAVPSLVVVLVSLGAIVDKHTDASISEALTRAIDERAPEQLQPLLDHLVQQATDKTSQSAAGVAALVSVLIAAWGGAGAVGTLVYACTRVYGLADRRSYLARKLLTLALTVVGGIMVITAFVLFTVGGMLGDWLAESTDRDDVLVGLLSNGRAWSLLLVACSLALLYALAPNAALSYRWVLPGVVGASAAIGIAVAGAEILVRIVDPGSAFGAASSVLILLWLLYLISAIVVIGAEVNATLARRHDRRLAAFLARHPDRCLDRPPAGLVTSAGTVDPGRVPGVETPG